MLQYILRKLITGIPVIFTVSLIVFLLTYLAPGDPVLLLVPMDEFSLGADPQAQEQLIKELRHKYGLDRPVYIQYLDWLWRAVRGDLGQSVRTRQPVMQILAQRLPVTIELSVLSLLLAIIVGIPLGVIAARRQNSLLDVIASTGALTGISIPSFWLATILILIFAVELHWLPPTGFIRMHEDLGRNLRLMILPVATLSAALIGGIMRMTRTSMVDVLDQDYLVTAHAKGLTGTLILWRHALKNALIPVVTVIGLQLGGILGGATLIEMIFSIPGLGKITIDSINSRDYPVVQGAVLVSAVIFVFVNLVVDIIYGWLDPRVRYEQE